MLGVFYLGQFFFGVVVGIHDDSRLLLQVDGDVFGVGGDLELDGSVEFEEADVLNFAGGLLDLGEGVST